MQSDGVAVFRVRNECFSLVGDDEEHRVLKNLPRNIEYSVRVLAAIFS